MVPTSRTRTSLPVRRSWTPGYGSLISSTDPYLHTGLLAQFTGRLSIAAALRPHQGIGQHEVHRTLSTAVNAISLSLHREIRADRWMLLPPPLDLRG